jgi:hypothetical protein
VVENKVSVNKHLSINLWSAIYLTKFKIYASRFWKRRCIYGYNFHLVGEGYAGAGELVKLKEVYLTWVSPKNNNFCLNLS